MAVLPIDELKQKINSNIYQNSQQAITGARMNTILNDMVDSLDETETLDALSRDLQSAAQGVQTNAEAITANKEESDTKLTELEQNVYKQVYSGESLGNYGWIGDVNFKKGDIVTNVGEVSVNLYNIRDYTAENVTIGVGKTIILPFDVVAIRSLSSAGYYELIVISGARAEIETDLIELKSEIIQGKSEIETDLIELKSEIIQGKSEIATITFSTGYKQVELPFTIPIGVKIEIVGEIGIITGRTNASDSDYQTLSDGTITDREINFVKNKTAVGETTIGYTIKGLLSIDKEVDELDFRLKAISSFIGAQGLRKFYGNFSTGQSIELNDFPKDNKFGDVLCIRANIEEFNSISIGKQIGVESSYNAWLTIDNTNIYLYRGSNVNVPRETIAHNLTLTEFVSIELATNKDGSCSININTLDEAYNGVVNNFGGNIYGFWKILSNNTTLNGLKLSISNVCFRNPFWIFGASYESILTSGRWLYYLPDFGVDLDKLFINGYSGRASDSSYADFLRALEFAKPKYVYWTMYGNGSAESLDTYIGNMLTLSEEYGFELIIIDRPNSPTQESAYQAKNEVIAKYISMGVRYVNAKEALSENPDSPDGWYPGYLSSDGSHPTELGARALAYQVVLDIPEIVQYR